MTLKELKQITASIGEIQGWDFSAVRDGRDPVPWDYMTLVHNYLTSSSRVLDIGTGGGEKFLTLHFSCGYTPSRCPKNLKSKNTGNALTRSLKNTPLSEALKPTNTASCLLCKRALNSFQRRTQWPNPKVKPFRPCEIPRPEILIGVLL